MIKPKCDKKDNLSIEYDKYIANREVLRISGTPVSTNIIDKILNELKQWSNSGLKSGVTRERPSIQASSYMILKSPSAILKLDIKTFEKN